MSYRPEQRLAAKTNAQELENELVTLQARLDNSRMNHHEFWAHVKEISQRFKTLKPLAPPDRERLWAKFGSICSDAKNKETHDREKRKHISEQKRSLVESKITEAYYQAKGSHSSHDLARAQDLLREALGWMKDGWSEFNLPTQLFSLDDGRMTKDDHDACWKKWQEANEAIKFKRKDLGHYNFSHFESEANSAIGVASYEPKQAKEKVKAIQAALRGKVMDRDQFKEIQRLLDLAWERASGKQKAQAGEWRARQSTNLARKRELIENAEDQIRRLSDQIDHCRGLERDARTSDFAETVRGWIEEKYDKINAKRAFIRELEEQIRSIEAKLR